MAGRSTTHDRVGQNTPSPEAEPDAQNAQGQAPRDMELLWVDRQSPPHAAFLRGDLPDAAQVAQSAQSAPKYDLAGFQSDAGLPAAWGKPAGICESELT